MGSILFEYRLEGEAAFDHGDLLTGQVRVAVVRALPAAEGDSVPGPVVPGQGDLLAHADGVLSRGGTGTVVDGPDVVHGGVFL